MPYKFNPFTGNLDIEGPIITGTVISAADGTEQVPGINFDNDPNTGIYRPGADQLAISTNGTERMRIDSSGRLLVGTSSVRSVGGSEGNLQVEGTDTATSRISVTRNSNDSGNAAIVLCKSRGTAIGSSTILQNNDTIGRVIFAADDGNDINTQAAFIECSVDGTPGADDMPGRLVFSTTADGSNSPTERMRIDSSGRLLVGTSSYPGNAIAVINGNNSSSTGAAALEMRYGTTRPTTADQLLGIIRFSSTSSTAANERYAEIAAYSDGASTSDGDIPGRLVFSTTADGASSPTERMRIDSSGNVGVGTASPATKLHVSNGSSASALINPSGGSVTYSARNADNTSYTSAISDAIQHIYRVSGTERMRITSAGYVAIGTTSATELFNVKSHGFSGTEEYFTTARSRGDGTPWYIRRSRVGFGGGQKGRAVINLKSSSGAPAAFHKIRVTQSGALTAAFYEFLVLESAATFSIVKDITAYNKASFTITMASPVLTIDTAVVPYDWGNMTVEVETFEMGGSDFTIAMSAI